MNKDMMMEVFIPTPEKFMEFDQTGVPWENVVAFVGHQMPKDPSVFNLIHDKGALCILGTSRNLDRDFTEGRVSSIEDLREKYNSFLKAGADILETDIPVPVSKILENRNSIPPSQKKFLFIKH